MSYIVYTTVHLLTNVNNNNSYNHRTFIQLLHNEWGLHTKFIHLYNQYLHMKITYVYVLHIKL